MKFRPWFGRDGASGEKPAFALCRVVLFWFFSWDFLRAVVEAVSARKIAFLEQLGLGGQPMLDMATGG